MSVSITFFIFVLVMLLIMLLAIQIQVRQFGSELERIEKRLAELLSKLSEK